MILEGLTRAVGSSLSLADPTTSNVIKYLGDNVLGQITTLLPVVIPTIIGFIAFRKGFKFLRSALKTA